MDKLERVLAAEEAARHAVSTGRERAETIRAEGRAHAREAAAAISAEASAKADAERDRVIGEAAGEAAALASAAEAHRTEALGKARLRIDAAADAVVQVLRG